MHYKYKKIKITYSLSVSAVFDWGKQTKHCHKLPDTRHVFSLLKLLLQIRFGQSLSQFVVVWFANELICEPTGCVIYINTNEHIKNKIFNIQPLCIKIFDKSLDRTLNQYKSANVWSYYKFVTQCHLIILTLIITFYTLEWKIKSI